MYICINVYENVYNVSTLHTGQSHVTPDETGGTQSSNERITFPFKNLMTYFRNRAIVTSAAEDEEETKRNNKNTKQKQQKRKKRHGHDGTNAKNKPHLKRFKPATAYTI